MTRLLRHHPIGADVNPKRDAAVRKLIKRLAPKDLDALFTLRETELATGGDAETSAAELEKLRSVRAAIARVRRSGALALRRFDLAINGQEVMQALGCGPGRIVGQALRHLTDQVVEDPARNTPEQLRHATRTLGRERSTRRGSLVSRAACAARGSPRTRGTSPPPAWRRSARRRR